MLALRTNQHTGPSPEEQHLVERGDHVAADEGDIAPPGFRPPACLARLVRSGAITPQMARAGGRFCALYRAAAIDRDGAGEQVHQALRALGGARSPAGSCIANVIGAGEGLTAWAQMGWRRMPVHATYATGILISALGTLQAHFEQAQRRV